MVSVRCRKSSVRLSNLLIWLPNKPEIIKAVLCLRIRNYEYTKSRIFYNYYSIFAYHHPSTEVIIYINPIPNHANRFSKQTLLFTSHFPQSQGEAHHPLQA